MTETDKWDEPPVEPDPRLGPHRLTPSEIALLRQGLQDYFAGKLAAGGDSEKPSPRPKA